MREDWVECTFGDVFFTTSGGTPSRQKSEYYNGSIPWVKSGELKSNIIIETEEYITELAVEKSSAKLFPKGTLLLALYGATIGKTAILGIDATTNQAICGIFETPYVFTKYTYYYLQNRKEHLIKLGTGGAQPNISQNIVKALNFPLPPLPEQRAIVKKIEALFSSLDAGIADLKKAQDQLKIYRQAVLKKAFEGELTKEWREKKGIEYEWLNMTVNQLCLKVTDGSHFSPNSQTDGVPYITVKDIKNDTINFDNSLRISEEDYEILKKNDCQPFINDILFSKDGTVGKVSLIDFDKKFVVLSSLAILRTNVDIVNTKYFFHYLKSNIFQSQAIKQKKGVAIRRVILRDLKEIKVLLPISKSEQAQIVKEIEARLSVCDAVEQQIKDSLTQGEALRQSILKKAFEGELLTEEEIKACQQAPDYEPARVLLEKIKAEKETNKSSKKTTKGKPKKKMEKKEILQLLAENNNEMLVDQLWKNSVYVEDIDAFYLKLKELAEAGKITEVKNGKKVSIKLI